MLDIVLIYKTIRNISAILKRLQHIFTCRPTATVINIKLHTVTYLHANNITTCIQHSSEHIKT